MREQMPDSGDFANPVADSGMFESETNSDAGSNEAPNNVVPQQRSLDLANPENWGDLKLSGIMRGDVDEFILNWCKNACASTWLDTTVLVCIIFNTLLLAYAGPANTHPEDILTAMMIADLVLTLIFSIEMFIRIIALGFYDRTGVFVCARAAFSPSVSDCASRCP